MSGAVTMSTTTTNAGATNFVPTTHHDTYNFIKSIKADFRERTVLITGASKGIGQAMAVSFARAGYGQIALLALSSVGATVEKARAAAVAAGHHPPPRFLEMQTDVSSVEAVQAAASEVQATFGSVDILINNAGYLEVWKDIHVSDPTDWWRAWEVNVKGTYLVSRAFLPLVLNSEQKTIVTVSSAGAWFTLRGASAYEGTKTAQVRLNNHLHFEYADKVGAALVLIFPLSWGEEKNNHGTNIPRIHQMRCPERRSCRISALHTRSFSTFTLSLSHPSDESVLQSRACSCSPSTRAP